MTDDGPDLLVTALEKVGKGEYGSVAEALENSRKWCCCCCGRSTIMRQKRCAGCGSEDFELRPYAEVQSEVGT